MGINIQALKALLHENNYKKLSGDILLVGRSTVTISKPRLNGLLKDYNLILNLKNEANVPETRHSNEEFDVDDIELFNCLSDEIKSINVLDVSDYEGADVIVDLNNNIGNAQKKKYDFIFDSSVLDNIFNPAQGIFNLSSLLKNKGRILHLHHTSFFPGSMIACPPEWFYSFYSLNGAHDTKIYLAEQLEDGFNRFEFKTQLFKYKPSYTYNKNYNRFVAATRKPSVYYTIALMEADNSWEARKLRFPSNLQYVSSSNEVDWSKREEEFCKTSRPIISGLVSKSEKINTLLPHETDHYELVSTDF